MSSQGQEAAPPTFLRLLSRPLGRNSNSATPNHADGSGNVIGIDDVQSPPSKLTTPFKRLKSQLGKISLKEKGKAVERTPPANPEPPTLEPIQQIDQTTAATQPSLQDTEPTAKDDKEEHDPSIPHADDDSQTICPTTLARRIHSLLSPFPALYTLTPSGAFLPSQTPEQCGAAADSTFLSLLASVSAMNGSISKGRESVWAALERLRYMPHPHPNEERREQGGGSDDNHDDNHDDDDARGRGAGRESDAHDMASVMICGPLQPADDDTEVEIARSEVVSVDDSGESDRREPVKERGVGMVAWSFGKGRRDADPAEKTLPPPPPPPPPPLPSPVPKQKEVRVWYASRTKVSFQAFWWGYRMSIS